MFLSTSFCLKIAFVILVNAIGNSLCQQSVAVHFYDVINAVPFNGSPETANGTGCKISMNDAATLECVPGITKLIDGNTGPVNSVLDDLGSFFAFSRQTESDSTLVFTLFSPPPTNGTVVLHFFNSPAQGIGLPTLSLTTGNIPVPFGFADNSDLSQTGSTIRNVTLLAALSQNFLRITITFSNDSKINWFMLSEVEFFDGTTMGPVTPIVFQGESSPLPISLGPDNPQLTISISCTVAVSGSFEWVWSSNGDQLSTDDRYSVWVGDATRTSVLEITELRYSDAGNYTCTVQREGDTIQYNRTSQLELNSMLIASNKNVSFEVGETAFLECELYGYLSSGDISWMRGGQTIQVDGKHTLTASAGSRLSISVEGSSKDSMVSVLQVNSLVESDGGTYLCMSSGIGDATEIYLNVLVPFIESSSVTRTTAISVSSETATSLSETVYLPSTSSATTTSSTGQVSQSSAQTLLMTEPPSRQESSNIGVIVGVVVVILIVIVLVNVAIVLIVVITCRKHNIHRHPSTHSISKINIRSEPVYSEINEKKPDKYLVIAPYSETEFLSESSNESIKITTVTERNESSSPPMYQEIPDLPNRHPPAKSPICGINPELLKDNPMYMSADNLDGCGGSSFNIYAQANLPPPIPDYYGTPENSIYNASIYSVDLDPSQFKSQENLSSDPSSASPYLMPCMSIYSDPEPIARNDILEVTESQINEIKELGMGQFGQVILAYTAGITLKELKLGNDNSSVSILVAVKKLGHEADEKERQTFEKEIKFMSRLKHENVVRLLGICLGQNAFIMMEYMENGDLNQYLQKFEFTRETSVPKSGKYLNAEVLTYVCLQVSAGMRYLASLNFVHRDLAARNCLVGQKYVVKIADFGMSRKLYDQNYYRVKGKAVLPIRWMSSECFYGRFSEKTDIWAFGVTMWEIFNFCKLQPYEELDDQEVIDNAIKGAGCILPYQSYACPDEVYSIMVKCWHHDPDKRARFEELHGYLSQIHAYSDMA